MAFRASAIRAERAIVYTQYGEPGQVLKTLTYKPLSTPPPGTLNLKVLLSPINPADLNTIQGVYPAKPTLNELVEGQPAVFIGGREGLAEVTQVGSGVSGYTAGDWVVFARAGSGTWASSRNVKAQEVLKLPRKDGLSQVAGATITVNPPTAYNMLNDFVTLKEGEDWVVQNGANSAVGQAVIQIAASKGLKTLNLVRARADFADLSNKLKALGATEVLTYDDLADRALTKSIVKDWTAGKGIRLGLNCVSGKDTTSMARLLGQDAYLVSYGAMSKEPLSLPTSLFFFKGLTATGFMQNRWNETHSRSDQEALISTLVDLAVDGKLKEPEHEIFTISGQDSDQVAGQKVQELMDKVTNGRYGKKVLLKFDDTH
ncbi:hypothetical protein FB45DRAFT_102988 [Roridomyces roridus]|uniref:enoyl-[acyl-carrier-protein] reductase n=1 Tax=Roridomyces roridus TaxID=1738132 RepID=A0AAD7BK60_9AGAR|nr:hypothetical protein FB45DRAFT_102988 [Roridomyces roridus]